MKKTLLLLLNILAINVYAQTTSIVLNPSKPEAGQKITVTYTGKLAKEGTKMSLILCYDENYRMPIKVMLAQLINNELVGSFTLPDSVSFFIIKIANKKEIDNNNGEGYGFNVYQDDKQKKGTFFSQGYSIFLNKWFFNGKIDMEKAVKLEEKEYGSNPDMIMQTRPYYIETLSKNPKRKVEAISLANQYFDEILRTGIDEKYANRYATIMADGKYKVYDSLKSIVAKKYPQGSANFSKQLGLLSRYSTNQPDSAIEMYKHIKKEFSNLSLNQEQLLRVELLIAYAKKYDFESFDSAFDLFLEKDKSKQYVISFAEKSNEIAWDLFQANKDLEKAKIIIEKSIVAHQQFDSLSTYYGNALDTYAAILFKLGDKQKAIANQKKAVSLTNYLNIAINHSLIKYLIDDKQFIEARTISEEFIVENVSNTKIDSLHKVAYIASNGGENGFKEAFAIIQEKSDVKYGILLQSNLINVDAPDFELKDLSGNKVKLSNFRGSIVVLDFWATWCGPCIASFPAMKKIMIELKDKPVKFLFIDTMENDESIKKTEKIKKTLENKKVSDFHVLLDEIKNLNYEVTTVYNISSIPAKFIIDSNGKIRYKSTGFSTDESLIRELKTVIKVISE